MVNYISGEETDPSQNRPSEDKMMLCHSFAHFVYNLSNGRFTVLDLQGVGDVFIDPAITSNSSIDPDFELFTPANNPLTCNTIMMK